MIARHLALSWKILLAAGLNALLVGVLLAATGAIPWPSDVQAFVMSAAGPAIGDLSQRVALDLQRTPAAQADRVLADYSREFGVTLLVCRNDATRVAGAALTLPAPVVDAVRGAGDRLVPGRGRGRGRPPGGELGRPGGRGGPNGIMLPETPPFLVRTGGSPGYWIGSRLPLPGTEAGEQIPGTLLVASDSFLGNPFLRRSMQWVVVALAAALMSIACWAPLLRGVTRTIRQLEQTTALISDGRFDARVDTSRGDELGRLGRSINSMAGRIDALVSNQTRFLGDTAHELRSPLGRMQVALGLLDTRVAETERGYIQDLHEDVDLLSAMTAELLELARARLAPPADPPAAILLAEMVDRVVKLEGRPGADLQVHVDRDLLVIGYERDLTRALGNVLRNAVRYAGASGPITISAGRRNGSIEVTVSDCGPGVPPGVVDRLFEPFFRLDPSRDRKSGGTGLGLAIARSGVEACGGRIAARNRAPSGLDVVITLLRA